MRITIKDAPMTDENGDPGGRELYEATLQYAGLTISQAEAAPYGRRPNASHPTRWQSRKLADVLDDDGNVDAEKVTAAAREARERLGIIPTRAVPRAS
jgi:hypothetical protein